MALQLKDNFYIVHHNPVNRRQKKIAQKEFEKIQRELLPIVLIYLEEENKTDSLKLFAKEQYIKRITYANKGNIFVTADKRFFDKHFPTQNKIDSIVKPRKKALISAWVVIVLLSLISLIIATSLFFS